MFLKFGAYLNDVCEKRVCPEHGEYMATIHLMKSQRGEEEKVEVGCPVCRAIAAKKKAEDEERRAYEHMLDMMAIPEKYRSCRLSTFRTDSSQAKALVLQIGQSYVDKFDRLREKGQGMVFVGQCGTGKTHLACAVLQELMNKCAGFYTTAFQMGQKVAESWGHKEPGHATADVKRVFFTYPLLVVDEVGKENAKPITKEVLSEVLYARYDAMLPTIWITNAETGLLKEAIGVQEYDRLKETCKFVNFRWPSMRKNEIDF